jgi:uncharacterized protein YjbI with pentapeptide repeats
MANEEQLAILRQGVEVWNKWREEHKTALIDLADADLKGANLRGADLSGSLGSGKDTLIIYGITVTNLNLAANPRETRFLGDHFTATNLSRANFRRADLVGANLLRANLLRANLMEADLRGANLVGADLRGAHLDEAVIGGTIFGDIDLHEAYGLDIVIHRAASTIGTDTIELSKGKIPEVFLRGCGLRDWEIASAKLYNPDLTNEEIVKIQYRIYDLRATQAIQIAPLFISYSHADKPFVDKIDSEFTKKGVRFWRDIHDATAGRLETQIDRAIRQNPTVLLVLSKNSIKSDWVEHEVRTARGLEKELGRDALCPIALDDSWKSSPWSKRVMEQVMEYNILDFSNWKSKSEFEGKFAKLLNGLDLFYKKAKE